MFAPGIIFRTPGLASQKVVGDDASPNNDMQPKREGPPLISDFRRPENARRMGERRVETQVIGSWLRTR